MGRPTLSVSDALILGETTFRGTGRPFGILPPDRLRHLYLLGKTGVGKSSLLTSLIRQDLRAGHGVAVLDPHGPLVASVLGAIPPSRTHDTLLLDPSDADFPTSINVFRQGRRAAPDSALLTSQLVSVFRKQWASSWGPRLEHVLRNALLAVASHPDATLLLVYRFLTDDELRDKVLRFTRDPVVRSYWQVEFEGYSRSFRAEVLSPVLNKLGAFLSNPTVRHLVGSVRTRIDIAEFLERSGIVLASLSTGLIGEDSAHLLGGLLLSTIQLAAMRRPPGAKPFFIYVDEFQNFVSDALSTLLSESRKYGIGLTLAHQYLAQLPPGLQASVLGNVGSMIIFCVGAEDAQRLAPDFAPNYTASDLAQLGPYETANRLLVDGRTLPPFSGRTITPEPSASNASAIEARVRASSRTRFAQSRDVVQRAIARSYGV